MKRKFAYFAVIAAVLIVGGIFLFNNRNNTATTFEIRSGNFVNQVSVSGKVVAAEEVELSFEKGGRIEQIYFKVGQSLRAGSSVAKIDAKDAEKTVRDSEISLEAAKISLAKAKIENSEGNLSADLAKAYEDAFTAVSDSFLNLSVALTDLEDVLEEDNLSDNSARFSGKTATSYRTDAEKLYYQASKVFYDNKKNFRLLDRGSSVKEIEAIMEETYETAKIFSNMIKSMRNFVDYMADDSNDATLFVSSQNTLATHAGATNDNLAALVNARIDIKNLKDAFPSVDLDIADLELAVKQKENSLQDAKNKLSDYYIRAPFDGVITKIDAKVGEIATAGEPLITIMSASTFQIESYVPEINIALIKLGDGAKITLDAYGDDVFFEAKVVSIDPAETIRDGVSTYKIKLQFTEEDERVKSGMTANVSILIFNKPNVIVVPGGVVFEKNGKKFVQVKNGKEINMREITTGDVSALGQIEVVSGLEGGEQIILNPQKE